MGDQDLRAPPLIDHDMRGPPVMMGGDKDMRQPPMGDQDLRSMNVPPGLGDARTFNDPRYRNVPPGPVTNMGPTRGPPGPIPNMNPARRPPGFDRPGPQAGLPADTRPGFDGRGVSMSPRVDDPRGPVVPPAANMPPGRMPSVSSQSSNYSKDH